MLDTSTVLLLGRLPEDADLPREPVISSITLAELSVGPLTARTDDQRAMRQLHVQQAEADFDALPFDAAAARTFGQVAAELRQTGQKAAARSFDALIAAAAMSRGLPLYTCNPADFSGITDLDLRHIPHPDAGGS